jgi:hypothetical protein
VFAGPLLNKVENREEEDPDDVNEMPIRACKLDGEMIVGGEATFERKHKHCEQ